MCTVAVQSEDDDVLIAPLNSIRLNMIRKEGVLVLVTHLNSLLLFIPHACGATAVVSGYVHKIAYLTK